MSLTPPLGSARPDGGPSFSLAWEKVDLLRADGIDDLLIQNWKEIESDTDSVRLDPDWERIRVLEKQGYFLVLAARDSERVIVGYAAFHVSPRIHAKGELQAANDLIYVLPEWRARVGLPLIKEAERALRGMGVRRITYASKTHLELRGATNPSRLGPLLRARGYVQIESTFAKRF